MRYSTHRRTRGPVRYSAAVLLFVLFSNSNLSLAQETIGEIREGGDYGRLIEARAKWNIDRIVGDRQQTAEEVMAESYRIWRSMDNRRSFKGLATSSWREISKSQLGGSSYNSGRIRAVAFDPVDPKIVYIGAAQGGIWKTFDILANPVEWTYLSASMPSIAMGALAVDPNNRDVIYAGTGESVGGFSTDDGRGNGLGAGLFKSTDGGMNWTLSCSTTLAGTICGQIAIDPKNSNNVYVATGAKGVIKSTDAGATWAKLSNSAPANNTVSIVINPNEPNRLYAAAQSGGGVWRTEDTGASWTKCTLTGLTGGGRVNLSIAPSDPSIVYAGVVANGGAASDIFITKDHGVTWRQQMHGTSPANNPSGTKVNYLYNSTQGNYANAIVVSPLDAKRILVGGLAIWGSSDSGKNLFSRSKSQEGLSDYSHADIHVLVYSPDGKILVVGNDGGVMVSQADGTQWSTAPNINLGTLQFVGVDADPDFTFMAGGTQDNGVNRAGVGEQHYIEKHGGDGGWTRVAEDDPKVVFSTSVAVRNGNAFAKLIRSVDGGATWGVDGQDDLIECNGPLQANNSQFYPPFDVSSTGAVVAYAGGSSIWVSTTGGNDCMSFIKATLVGGSLGTPSSVHIAHSDPVYMWVGTSSAVWRSEDQGVSLTKVAVTGLGSVTGIAASRTDADRVYAVGIGSASAANKQFARSKDGGKTWESPATNLQTMPLLSIAVDKRGTLYAGTNQGVLVSEDDGVTWNPIGEGLPIVQVLSLRVRGKDDNQLVAGTFGRGGWSLQIGPVNAVEPEQRNVASLGSYPSPVTAAAQEATIRFDVKHAAEVTVKLHDMLGREVRTLAKRPMSTGVQEITFDVTSLTPGTYFYSIVSDGAMVSDKIVIAR